MRATGDEFDTAVRPVLDAAEIFAQYLSDLADGRARDFGSVKSRQPQLSPHLERLREQHRRMHLVLASLAGSASARLAATSVLPDDAQARLTELLQLCNGTGVVRYADPELIGSGGMGEVYRIRDRVLQRQVVVKVILGNG